MQEAAQVRVMVRVRPFDSRELNTDKVVEVETTRITIKNPENRERKIFEFDSAFDTHSEQNEIFDVVGEKVLLDAYKGYNTCVFAYGQTGSGKTFTMMGADNNYGLIPRICNELFIRQPSHNGLDKKGCQFEYRLEVSYLEIYAENVRDLLNHKNVDLKVRNHNELGPYVEGLSKVAVNNYAMISALIEKGNSLRATASTNMNARSSRSHAILTLHFTQLISDPTLGKPREVTSKINLVDLAGSEKIEQSGVEGINLQEAIHINKSLSMLGLVIMKLAAKTEMKKVEPVKKPPSRQSSFNKLGRSASVPPKTMSPPPPQEEVVNFRDSKLTWILKDSLGGNSITHVMATISPSSKNFKESLSTLRFASNAKCIVNTVRVNEDPNDKIINSLRNELEMLRKKLSSGRLSLEDDVATREQIKSSEQLLLDRDKSWEQKLQDREQFLGVEHAKIVAQKEEEQKKLIEERERLLAEKEKEKLEEIKKQQLEFQQKQEEFENTRILKTATKLNEYYEERLKKIQDQADQKITEMRKQCDENILKIKSEANMQIAEIKATSDQRVEAIKFEYEKKFAALRVEQEKNMKEIETKSMSDLAHYKEKTEVLQKELALANKKFQSQLAQLNNDRQILTRQLQTVQSKLNENKNSPAPISSPAPRIDRVPSADRELEEVVNGIQQQKKEDEQKYDELKVKYESILKKIDESSNLLAQAKDIQDWNEMKISLENTKKQIEELSQQKNKIHSGITKCRLLLEEKILLTREKLKNPTISDFQNIHTMFSALLDAISRELETEKK